MLLIKEHYSVWASCLLTVYDYLMSSLRLSALYFSGCSDQMQWATLDEPVVAENIGAKQG